MRVNWRGLVQVLPSQVDNLLHTGLGEGEAFAPYIALVHVLPIHTESFPLEF